MAPLCPPQKIRKLEEQVKAVTLEKNEALSGADSDESDMKVSLDLHRCSQVDQCHVS